LDRKKILHLPFFPNYLFVRGQMSKDEYIEILKTMGVIRLLGNGYSELVPIPDEEIESVNKLAQHQGQIAIQLMNFIQTGEKVRISEGPLAGVVGTLVDKNVKKSQLSVSLELMNRSLIVAVDTKIVEKVQESSSLLRVGFQPSFL
jgi:transcription antitermination factor NusG